jgi:hypothetical protein
MVVGCVVLLGGTIGCGSGGSSRGPSVTDASADGAAGTSAGGSSGAGAAGNAAAGVGGSSSAGAAGNAGAAGMGAGGSSSAGAAGMGAGGSSSTGAAGMGAGGSSGAGGASSGGDDSPTLIAGALGAGEITAEQALIYEVFAVFGDARLPAQYRGDDSQLFESDVLSRAFAAFASLSTNGQTILLPFLLRPSEPGSWADPAAPAHFDGADPGAPGDTLPLTSPFCKGETSAAWMSKTTPTAHVQVWYDSTVPGDDVTAATLLTEVETVIWPALVTKLGLKAPLSDADPTSGLDCAGSDGRLDIYVVERGAFFGMTYPRDLEANVACKQVPVVIYVDKAKAGIGLTATLTHEMMHAIQWAYPSMACHDDYGWLKDATANWAIDYVYHGLATDIQAEQNWSDCFTQSPEKALDDRSTGSCVAKGKNTPRDYGSYLFFQFVSNRGSPALVKGVLDSLASYATSLEPVGGITLSATSDYLRDNWNEFSKALVNKMLPGGVLQPNFHTWDMLPDMPKWLMDESFAGVSDKKVTFVPAINNLSTHLYHFSFPDQSARTLLFSNGFFKANTTDKKAIHVTGVWHDASGTWQEEDWSPYQSVGLCRDSKNQRTDELIVIVSNGEWQVGGGGVLSTQDPFFLEASSVGCWRYRGTSTCQDTGAVSGGTTQVTSDLSFILDPRAAALGLSATHPAIPDSLRAGLWFDMPLEFGQPVAAGSYTYQAMRTTGMCAFTFGPIQNPIGGTEAGVLQINTFPDLVVPSSAGDLVSFVAKPQRYYQLNALSTAMYQTNPTDSMCTPEPLQVGIMASNISSSPMLVAPNGTITATFSAGASSCAGTFTPVLEP